jgi:hypothetical protein
LKHHLDLAHEYQVICTPTLLLLDSADQIVWRQNEVITDELQFDLMTLERQIEPLETGE